MKTCPKCNRTYADDGFTFCLEDGALLSAPFEGDKTEPISTIQSGGPAPTAVLPARPSSADSAPAPTIASPPPPAHRVASVTPRKKKVNAVRIVVGILLFLGLGYLVFQYFYIRNLRRCPWIRVECVQANRSARCYLTESSRAFESGERAVGPAITSLHPVLGLQRAEQLPAGISNVRWSVPRAKITSAQSGEVFIDTSGLEQAVIEVKARFDRDSLICPKEAETLFVVQRQQDQP